MRPGLSIVLVICALGTLSTQRLVAQDTAASPQVRREIERLRKSLKDKPISAPDFAQANGMVEDALKKAADTLDSGHLYNSLENLNQAAGVLQGARVAEEKAAAVQSGLPAFDAEWNKASLQLTALDAEARKQDWSRAPLALRALAEAAQGRSVASLDGSRGFATSTKPTDGLFYMGQAQAEAEFAKFCASLSLPHKPAPFPLRSFLPELQKLQEKTNAAFQPPKSIDQHSRFIALNSALKLAEELDASKFYAGALYQYLEATRQYGMLDGVVPNANRQSALKQTIAGAQRKLDQSERDDSIAQIFLGRAASYIAHPGGSAPTADEWKSAQLILDQVLPAYFAADKPAAPLLRASGKTVDITLVRWPYT